MKFGLGLCEINMRAFNKKWRHKNCAEIRDETNSKRI